MIDNGLRKNWDISLREKYYGHSKKWTKLQTFRKKIGEFLEKIQMYISFVKHF